MKVEKVCFHFKNEVKWSNLDALKSISLFLGQIHWKGRSIIHNNYDMCLLHPQSKMQPGMVHHLLYFNKMPFWISLTYKHL